MLTFTLVPLFVSGQALPICDDTPDIGVPCTLITHAMTCTNFVYNVTLLNSSQQTGSEVVTNASLSIFTTDIYQFNFTFTNTVDSYAVRLCDGFTTQLSVGGGTVTPAVVTGQLFFLTFTGLITLLLLVAAARLDDPVMGFLGSAGLFIIGWALLNNPFQFLTGQATFIGLNFFGLGVIVLGIYFLLNSLQLVFKNKSKVNVDSEL